MNLVECFNIDILIHDNNDNLFDISNDISIFKIKCLQEKLSINPIIIEADPFLFVFKDTLYLFYESKRLADPACIKMIYTKDLKNWSKPKIVLKESFHLSFPFVFEDNGSIYMIPESGEDRTVRLYKASSGQLDHFEFVTKLLVEKDKFSTMSYADSIIKEINGVYFLMTTRMYNDGINTLELYYSFNLKGPYKKHCQSPLLKSQKYGRNAGSLFQYQNKLFRFSQDCVNRYGDNVNISEIDELSINRYNEKLYKENIIPTSKSLYFEGGHQFNAVKFGRYWLIAVDYKEYHRLFFTRAINKILKNL